MKRARSPPFPPFVQDYAPYSGGQLRRLCYERNKDNHKVHWDLYYRNNTVNGYKDRHYLLREFDELRAAIELAHAATTAAASEVATADPHDPRQEQGGSVASFSWMEAGCGVGNAMLPVFEAHGHLPQWQSLLGFDISSVAIELLEQKVASSLPTELSRKVHVCVLDPCERDVAECPFFQCEETPGHSLAVPREPRNKVEYVSMVFVLCSIPVAKHELVLRRVAACMTQPTGVFFFRDYGVADHAETRFRKRDERCGNRDDVDANTYARTNGTLSHFFSLEEVRALFTSVGFTVIDLKEVERQVENRKTECVLARRFVQGRFRLTKLLQPQQ